MADRKHNYRVKCVQPANRRGPKEYLLQLIMRFKNQFSDINKEKSPRVEDVVVRRNGSGKDLTFYHFWER